MCSYPRQNGVMEIGLGLELKALRWIPALVGSYVWPQASPSASFSLLMYKTEMSTPVLPTSQAWCEAQANLLMWILKYSTNPKYYFY